MRELGVLIRVAPLLGESPLYYYLTRQKVPMDLIIALLSKSQDAFNLMPKVKEVCKMSNAECEAFLLYPPTAPWQAVSAVIYDLVALAKLSNMTALKAELLDKDSYSGEDGYDSDCDIVEWLRRKPEENAPKVRGSRDDREYPYAHKPCPHCGPSRWKETLWCIAGALRVVFASAAEGAEGVGGKRIGI